jgi:hypothetical protein
MNNFCYIVVLSLVLSGCVSGRTQSVLDDMVEGQKHEWPVMLSRVLDRDLCSVKLSAGNKYWSIIEAVEDEAERRQVKMGFCIDKYESCYADGLMEGTREFEDCIIDIQTQWAFNQAPIDGHNFGVVGDAFGNVFGGVVEGVTGGLSSRARNAVR